MKEQSKSGSVCPFEEGNRVDHKILGFGTVNGALTPMAGPDMHSPSARVLEVLLVERNLKVLAQVRIGTSAADLPD